MERIKNGFYKKYFGGGGCPALQRDYNKDSYSCRYKNISDELYNILKLTKK